MRTLARMVVLLGLGLSNAHAADCGLKMLGSVDIQVSPDRLLVPVSFGETRKNFILEIGSGLNMVTRETADQVGFRIRSLDPSISLHGFGQKMERIGYSPKFRLGSLPGDDVEFSILPERLEDPEVAGLLGNRLFEQLDFELDIAQAKLNVFSTDHCPEQVVYWTKTGFSELPFRREGTVITASMILDGKSVRARLSTLPGSIIGMNTIRQLLNLDESSPGMTLANTTPDGEKFYRYPFKGLTVDGLTVNNPNILIRGEVPGPPECTSRPKIRDMDAPLGHVVDKPTTLVTRFAPDITVGLSVLSKMHLYYSSKEKIIYATPASAR
jgi:hypothetical protein